MPPARVSVLGPRAGMAPSCSVRPGSTPASSTAQSPTRLHARNAGKRWHSGPMSSPQGGGVRPPVPHAGRRGRGPGHLRGPGAGARAVRRAALHPDRRPPAVPHRDRRARGLHPAQVRRVRRQAGPRSAGAAPTAARSTAEPPAHRRVARRRSAASGRPPRHRRRPVAHRRPRRSPRRPGRARPAAPQPSRRCSTASPPVLGHAAQRRGEPEPGAQRPGALGDPALGRAPAAEPTAARPTIHSAARVEQHQPSPARSSVPSSAPTPVTSSRSRRTDRAVQPGGEVDLGVLRPALLGDLRVALGQRQTLGLLLEVVEEVEQPLLPPHPRTLTGAGAGVNRLWTNG